MNVGFIGLGNMGSGMARNLIKATRMASNLNRTNVRHSNSSPMTPRLAGASLKNWIAPRMKLACASQLRKYTHLLKPRRRMHGFNKDTY